MKLEASMHTSDFEVVAVRKKPWNWIHGENLFEKLQAGIIQLNEIYV